MNVIYKPLLVIDDNGPNQIQEDTFISKLKSVINNTQNNIHSSIKVKSPESSSSKNAKKTLLKQKISHRSKNFDSNTHLTDEIGISSKYMRTDEPLSIERYNAIQSNKPSRPDFMTFDKNKKNLSESRLSIKSNAQAKF